MAAQNRSAQHHGADVEDHGGKARLSQEQPRKDRQSRGVFGMPAELLIGLGAVLILMGLVGGMGWKDAILGGLPMVGFGIFIAIGNKADREKADRRDSSSSSQTIQEFYARARQLEQLESLRRSGLLSDQEYQEKRKNIVDHL